MRCRLLGSGGLPTGISNLGHWMVAIEGGLHPLWWLLSVTGHWDPQSLCEGQESKLGLVQPGRSPMRACEQDPQVTPRAGAEAT